MQTLNETSMVSKTQDAFKIAQEAVNNPGTKIYINHQTGSGKWAKITYYAGRVHDVLSQNGVNFTIGNDAPRGGRLGDFVVAEKV